MAQLRAALAGQETSAARTATLTLALFAAVGGATASERQTLAEAAATLADGTRGSAAGPGPWATLAHVALWRCVLHPRHYLGNPASQMARSDVARSGVDVGILEAPCNSNDGYDDARDDGDANNAAAAKTDSD